MMIVMQKKKQKKKKVCNQTKKIILKITETVWNKKRMQKHQRRSRSKLHEVFRKKVSKIAWSSNHDKRIQTIVKFRLIS